MPNSYQLLPPDDLTGRPATIVKRIAPDGSAAFVPMSEGNCDYDDYKAWLAAGNTPLPADGASP